MLRIFYHRAESLKSAHLPWEKFGSVSMERWLAETKAERPWNGIAGVKVIAGTNTECQDAGGQNQKDRNDSVMAQYGSTLCRTLESSNAGDLGGFPFTASCSASDDGWLSNVVGKVRPVTLTCIWC